MSKPASGLFHGTKGEVAFRGDAESVIALRVNGFDLREHPMTQRQLSAKARKEIARKIKNRTATREEYKRREWDRRFGKRRRAGVKNFYAQERERLARGERGTRNWSDEQRRDILAKKTPKFRGESLQGHHTYSVSKYPHLANRGEVIYPVTHNEHKNGWHGGRYKNSLPGKRIRPVHDF